MSKKLTDEQRDWVTVEMGYCPEDDLILAAIKKYENMSAEELERRVASLEQTLLARYGRGVELADELDEARMALGARQRG